MKLKDKKKGRIAQPLNGTCSLLEWDVEIETFSGQRESYLIVQRGQASIMETHKRHLSFKD